MQADGNPIEALPEDPAILQALLLAAWPQRDKVVAECHELAEQNEHLKHLVQKLTRLKFGAKSERWPEDQLQLALGDIETAIAQAQAQDEKRHPERRRDGIAKRRARSGALPADLSRVEVTLMPKDTSCPCCRAAMTEIGHDESQRLDMIPVQYRVIVTRRPKFACRAFEGVVVQEPAPPRLIEGGIPTEALVANVRHSQKDYVRGIVHVNSAEGFSDRVRRTVVGVFHHISTDHANLYLNEFGFRWSQTVAGQAIRQTRKGRSKVQTLWDRIPTALQIPAECRSIVGRQIRLTRNGGITIKSSTAVFG